MGVNKYVSDEDTSPEVLHVDEEVAELQRERLASVKEERDDEEVQEALDDLQEAIQNDENVMPYVVTAVKAYATMGEIMDVFEAEHGAYREKIGLA